MENNNEPESKPLGNNEQLSPLNQEDFKNFM